MIWDREVDFASRTPAILRCFLPGASDFALDVANSQLKIALDPLAGLQNPTQNLAKSSFRCWQSFGVGCQWHATQNQRAHTHTGPLIPMMAFGSGVPCVGIHFALDVSDIQRKMMFRKSLGVQIICVGFWRPAKGSGAILRWMLATSDAKSRAPNKQNPTQNRGRPTSKTRLALRRAR